MYFTKTAEDVIVLCKESRRNIQGLEAFRLSGHGIQPSQNNSIWFEENKENWNKAIDFVLKKENSEFLYEIWYEGY